MNVSIEELTANIRHLSRSISTARAKVAADRAHLLELQAQLKAYRVKRFELMEQKRYKSDLATIERNSVELQLSQIASVLVNHFADDLAAHKNSIPDTVCYILRKLKPGQ